MIKQTKQTHDVIMNKMITNLIKTVVFNTAKISSSVFQLAGSHEFPRDKLATQKANSHGSTEKQTGNFIRP